VWKLLLDAGPAARSNSAYQRDLVDTTRQALGNLGVILQKRMAIAYDDGDLTAFEKAADDFMTLGRRIDEFLGCRSEYMLGKWIDDARSWAGTNESAYYESNARTIITTWGGRDSELTDYACRQWNGLIRDYYLPRWQMLIDAAAAELKGGPKIDSAALEKQFRDHDWAFASGSGSTCPNQAHGDCFAMSKALFGQYSNLTEIHSTSLGSWSPATTPKEYAEMDFPLNAKLPRSGTLHLRLQYESGAKALEIQSVAITVNGKMIAEDRHAGWTGIEDRKNSYTLHWPADSTSGDAVLVVTARGAGGTDSNGTIYIEGK